MPGIPGPNSLAMNTPLSPIVQSDRMYNTSQTNLPFNNNLAAQEIYAPIGHPVMRQKNLPIPSRTRSIDMTVDKSRTPELENCIEKYVVTKPKLSPVSTDSAASGDGNNYPYNLSTANEKSGPGSGSGSGSVTGPISFSHSFRARNLLMPVADLPDDKVKSSSEPTDTSAIVPINIHPYNLSISSRDSNSNSNSNEKPFNFMRMADNISPPKIRSTETKSIESNTERIKTKLFSPPHEASSSLYVNVETAELPRTGDSVIALEKETNAPTLAITKTQRFLRPSSLPLKPGTFTPKRHHGITPTANTFALISPETPRPSKHCVQLYLNGHAYTYLGLKCSTKTFYCTVNRPQPVHFPNQSKLSIYCNWQTCAEKNPTGFTPKEMMSFYDSRQRLQQCQRGSKYTTANRVQYKTLHSQSSSQASTLSPSSDPNNFQIRRKVDEHPPAMIEDRENDFSVIQSTSSAALSEAATVTSGQIVPVLGGYKSNEDYTYIRGRGRGRYVCSKCGIRCKKPSMLKKHIKTHSDIRPYECKGCRFRYFGRYFCVFFLLGKAN